LFRHTKNLQIWDRLIGEKLQRNPNGKYMLQANFERGLKWVIEQFYRFANIPHEVEIICGTRLSRSKAERAAQDLQLWANDLSFPFSIFVTMILQKNGQEKMSHDRFLKTDQVILQLGRGFDLLDNDNKLRTDSTLNVLGLESEMILKKEINRLQKISSDKDFLSE
jgi:hypothetical protein